MHFIANLIYIGNGCHYITPKGVNEKYINLFSYQYSTPNGVNKITNS
jgi:hypothetical protein